MAGGASLRLHQLGQAGRGGLQPQGSPGWPTVVIPGRIGYCPVMKAARPAVQEAARNGR